MNKNTTIDVAKRLINEDRHNAYGNATDNFDNIAARWSQLLNIKVESYQVGIMMADLKIARMISSATSDCFVDAIGYLALAAEVKEVTNK